MKIDTTHHKAAHDLDQSKEKKPTIREKEAMLKAAELRLERMNPKNGYHFVKMGTDHAMQQTFNAFCGKIPREGRGLSNRVAVQVY